MANCKTDVKLNSYKLLSRLCGFSGFRRGLGLTGINAESLRRNIRRADNQAVYPVVNIIFVIIVHFRRAKRVANRKKNGYNIT